MVSLSSKQTVEAGLETWKGRLTSEDSEGRVTDYAILVRPRSYLVVGSLTQFSDEHGVAEKRYKCFENFRRSLMGAEVLTYDELFARAYYLVYGHGLQDGAGTGRQAARPAAGGGALMV